MCTAIWMHSQKIRSTQNGAWQCSNCTKRSRKFAFVMTMLSVYHPIIIQMSVARVADSCTEYMNLFCTAPNTFSIFALLFILLSRTNIRVCKRSKRLTALVFCSLLSYRFRNWRCCLNFSCHCSSVQSAACSCWPMELKETCKCIEPANLHLHSKKASITVFVLMIRHGTASS